MLPDFIFNLHTPGLISYDIETLPNVFTFRCLHRTTRQRWYFEISFRRNDMAALCLFIETCRLSGCQWVGFNNLGFDYPVVHFIYNHRHSGLCVGDIYTKAMDVLKSNNKFGHLIWDSDQLVPQIDLFKIHHFDNKAKMTSLKVIEFNMRMNSVDDLPFPVGTMLNNEQADILCTYNDHDVDATDMFLERTLDMISLRASLSEQFGMNLINCNDVKIGEKILVAQMEKAGISCYEYVNGRKQKKQTIRSSIDLSTIVFPYVSFERIEFKRIHEFFIGKVITETNGIFKNLTATVDGCEYKFGTGGLHMSVSSQSFASDDEYQIVDVDVEGFYPALAIKNRVYPAHLGEGFCDVLERDVVNIRKQYSKKDPRNGAYKLAANGVYGLSNNEFSPFLDAAYTMAITINGQLLLCMLVEQLVKAPGLKMMQANTDGVTFLCPRPYLSWARDVCRWWEGITKLTLEEVRYSRMFINNVNNYIAVKEDGSIKRIGAYAYETAEENSATRELPHHKDWSARVVQKAVEANLVHGKDIHEFITTHQDKYDFLLRTKVPRSSQLLWGTTQVANIVRYYISDAGRQLEKLSPPTGAEGSYKRAAKVPDDVYNQVIDELMAREMTQYTIDTAPSYDEVIAALPWDARINTKNKSKHTERRTRVHTGWKVQMCDRLDECAFDDINYEWYINEAKKLASLEEIDNDE